MIALAIRETSNQIGDSVNRREEPRSRCLGTKDKQPDGKLDKARKLVPRSPTFAACPTLILVEHRDEVYARLAADLARFEVDLVRTESVDDARLLVSRCDSALVIVNRDVPDHSGWVLADKLRSIPHVEVWMYFPQASTYAKVLAEFQRVTELIAYHGDLFALSDLLMERLQDWRNAAAFAPGLPVFCDGVKDFVGAAA